MRSIRNVFVVMLLILAGCAGRPALPSARGIAGGATSGGGDDIGLQVSDIRNFIGEVLAGAAIAGISEEQQKTLLAQSRIEPTIVIVDEPLPAVASDVVQSGVAHSEFDGDRSATLKIHRARWMAIAHPPIREGIVFHELAVMAGLERTGYYGLTKAFLAAREELWNRSIMLPFLCSITLLEWNEQIRSFLSTRWRSVGSGAIGMDWVGVSSAWTPLLALAKPDRKGRYRALIARAVVGNGYLRMSFSEATLLKPKNDEPNFEEIHWSTEEKVYWDPYRALPRAHPSVAFETVTEKYKAMIACTKQAARP